MAFHATGGSNQYVAAQGGQGIRRAEGQAKQNGIVLRMSDDRWPIDPVACYPARENKGVAWHAVDYVCGQKFGRRELSM